MKPLTALTKSLVLWQVFFVYNAAMKKEWLTTGYYLDT